MQHENSACTATCACVDVVTQTFVFGLFPCWLNAGAICIRSQKWFHLDFGKYSYKDNFT